LQNEFVFMSSVFRGEGSKGHNFSQFKRTSPQLTNSSYRKVTIEIK
jgi:hypothetical protein